MSDSEFEDIDEKLQELNQEVSDLSERCHYRTMLRVANEAKRLARVEQRLMPYMTASFHVMNDSRNILQPAVGRDVAIELITLLESEDRARLFQPNLPEDEYQRTKWWLTACSYDNLAVNTAESNGYNSDGMHQCITDGIQVCRRTGKMQCISCFREYATDVYIAADDLDMALHHARVGINNKDPGPHDRRHVGAKDSMRILMANGQVEAALEMLDLSWKLSEVYHSPYAGRLDTYLRAVELCHLAGCPEKLDALPKLLSFEEGEVYDGPDDAVIIEPPRDEFPAHFLDHDLAYAFVENCRGDHDAAIAMIQPWDVLLREQKCTTKWFEVRLRLVAIARLTDKMPRAQALARPLQEAAQQARDWVTLRRLERILDESIPVTPLALCGPVTIGPFADKTTVTPVVAIADDVAAVENVIEEQEAGEDSEAVATPLGEAIQEFYGRMIQSGGEPDVLAAILNDILAVSPDTVTHLEDASQLMHVVRFVNIDESRATETWHWSEALTKRFPQNAAVLSMQAALGNHLRGVSDGALDELITTDRLWKQFRESLDLDTNSSDNFARAGSYYLEEEDYGEAERCLARGFRLNRSSGHLALRLSEVYTRTDRPRDAVAVLDMALREGCDDPDVAWEAAMNAIHTEQYEATLTYLDRYDALLPEQPWSNYYRASALLELHRPAESLAALVLEMQFNPDLTYHVLVLRASALAALNEIDAFRKELGEVLAMPLSEVTYLTANGLQKMFVRLWQSTRECVGQDDQSLVQLETRLLESGLAPNELFAVYRQPVTEENSQNKVNFYRCMVHQPLDERWLSFGGQLAGEEDWTAYDIPWGVLAHDETEAGQMAMQWQQRCFPLAAELLGIEEEGTDYTDAAGVVWQGYREGIQPDSDDEDESEIE
ncbi:MAG: hypothetical protein JWP89_3109 [Schlesneria sp.]|nr:hypothetical protein [Schlesneria sp.]